MNVFVPDGFSIVLYLSANLNGLISISKIYSNCITYHNFAEAT